MPKKFLPFKMVLGYRVSMGRPAKEPKEKLTELPCKVSLEVAEEIARIAESLDRSRSQIARKLISRGLAAYMRDGSLDEPPVKKVATGREKHAGNPIPTESVSLPINPHTQYPTEPLIRDRKKGGKK
jgi:hypothetical protein